MNALIALLALFSVACGGSSDVSSGTPTAPTAPVLPTVPPSPAQQIDGGQWSQRAPLIEANSELALAEVNGKIYLLGGYPANRQTARSVQVYDIAGGSWQLGPPLPQPNNHGMAAGVHRRHRSCRRVRPPLPSCGRWASAPSPPTYHLPDPVRRRCPRKLEHRPSCPPIR